MAIETFFTQKDAFRRRQDEEAEQKKSREDAKKNSWERLLTQMAAAQQMDGKTLAGIALGKLLHDAFFTWKENYDARGEANADFLMRSEDERNKILADLDQTNPERAARLRNFAGKNLPPTAQVNSDAIRPFAQEALTAPTFQGQRLIPETSPPRWRTLRQAAEEILNPPTFQGERLIPETPRPTTWQQRAAEAANLIQPPNAQDFLGSDKTTLGAQSPFGEPPYIRETALTNFGHWRTLPEIAEKGAGLELPKSAQEYLDSSPTAVLGAQQELLPALQQAAAIQDAAFQRAAIPSPVAQQQPAQSAAQPQPAAVQPTAPLASSAFARYLTGRNQTEADRIADRFSRQQSLNPNSIPTMIYEAIVGEKNRYESAPKGEQGDEQRRLAHDRANKFRALLNEQGYDFDGYSADDTLGEAENQLAVQNIRNVIAQDELMKQKASDITAAITQGDYVKNADQYYEDEYRRAINLGISPKHARKVAANRAREYQANRMAYLSQVFNESLDGYALSPQTALLIANMAHSDPQTANFIANWFPTGRDIYANQHEMDKLKSVQNHQINMSDLTHQQGFETRADEHRIHEAQADSAFERLVKEIQLRHKLSLEEARYAATLYLERMAHENYYAKDLYAHNAGIDTQQYGARKNIDLQYTQNLLPLYAQYGLNASGRQPSGNSGNTNAYKPYTDTMKNLIDYRNSITAPYKDGLTSMPNDVALQVRGIDQQIGDLYRQMGIGGGGGGQGRQQSNQRIFTGNFNEDSKTIAAMRDSMAREGRPWYEIKQILYEQMLADGCYEPYARGAVGL